MFFLLSYNLVTPYMGNVFKTPNHYEVYFVNYMHEEGPSDISGLNNLFKGKELKVFTIGTKKMHIEGGAKYG